MTRTLLATLTMVALVLVTTPVGAECQARFKFQCSSWTKQSRPVPIYKDRDFFPERVAEIYDPGRGRRLQIRDPYLGRVLGRIDRRTGDIVGPTDLRVRGRIGQ